MPLLRGVGIAGRRLQAGRGFQLSEVDEGAARLGDERVQRRVTT